MAVRAVLQSSDALTAARGARLLEPASYATAVRAACTIVGVTDAEISITWVTDTEIATLNQDYLAHTGPTDVISFHLYEEGERPVGDIYIGYEQAERQAASFGTTLHEELVRLAVHGTLHILGFDHPDEGDRTESEMWMLQEAIVAEVLA